MNIQQNK